MMRNHGPWLLVLALGSVGFDCGAPVNGNTGFDLWCAESLCAWTLEKGEIERVSTWHERDFAAELIGPEVTLSQVAVPDTGPCGSGPSAGCGGDPNLQHTLGLTLLASVERGTTLTFEADYDQDGTVDYRREVPPTWPAWADVRDDIVPPPPLGPTPGSRALPTPPGYVDDGVDDPRPAVFTIRKLGSGRAAVAQAVVWDACAW